MLAGHSDIQNQDKYAVFDYMHHYEHYFLHMV